MRESDSLQSTLSGPFRREAGQSWGGGVLSLHPCAHSGGHPGGGPPHAVINSHTQSITVVFTLTASESEDKRQAH